jgi:excisionase family DNA binding protein
MGLTITEAARLLNVKENVVRGYIATGKLAFDVQGGQLVIPQSAVDALMHPERTSTRSSTPLTTWVSRSAQEEAFRTVLKELFAIGEQLDNKWELFGENQRLHRLLRESDKVLAERNAEIERLKRELVVRKRLGEKEMEDGERTLDERLGALQEVAARQLAREQELCREKVSLLEQLWTQRLAEEAERCARQLADARKHEGLWARLVRMMTWS